MNPYLNALLLKWDGDANGKDAPSKAQVAATWGGAVALVMLIVR